MYGEIYTSRGACVDFPPKAETAPVRAVDVAVGNIAQAEFISAEHFNRKGSQTVYRPFGNCVDFPPKAVPRLFARLKLPAKAGNFAEPRFIRGEHFNQKGSHAVSDRVGIA